MISGSGVVIVISCLEAVGIGLAFFLYKPFKSCDEVDVRSSFEYTII